jgi:hypothetical protein
MASVVRVFSDLGVRRIDSTYLLKPGYVTSKVYSPGDAPSVKWPAGSVVVRNTEVPASRRISAFWIVAPVGSFTVPEKTTDSDALVD